MGSHTVLHPSLRLNLLFLFLTHSYSCPADLWVNFPSPLSGSLQKLTHGEVFSLNPGFHIEGLYCALCVSVHVCVYLHVGGCGAWLGVVMLCCNPRKQWHVLGGLQLGDESILRLPMGDMTACTHNPVPLSQKKNSNQQQNIRHSKL